MRRIKDYSSALALITITLFGFLLRLYNLDWQCLQVDEVVTQSAAMLPSMDIIRWSLSVDYNPPLYYLLAHWSSLMFGEASKFAIRFPSLIIGTLAIPATYFLGREIKGKTLGLLAATLISCMFPFFYYSQNARTYPLVMLAFICFSYFFVKIYRGDTSYKTIAGLSIFTALCFWSHYYSLVPIAILWLALFCKHRIAIITAGAITVILMFPMALMFDITQLETRTNHGVFNVLWTTPLQMAIQLPNEMLCWTWIIIVPLAAYALIKYYNPVLRIFAIAGIITPLLLIPLSHFTAIMPRYAILVSPLIIVAALYPISELIDRQPLTFKKIVIFIGIVFLISLFNIQSIIAWNTFDTCPLLNGSIKW